MGNIQKIGRCKIASVLKPAEEPEEAGAALHGFLERRR